MNFRGYLVMVVIATALGVVSGMLISQQPPVAASAPAAVAAAPQASLTDARLTPFLVELDAKGRQAVLAEASPDEKVYLQKLFARFPLPAPAPTGEVFALIDANHDGVIQPEEFAEVEPLVKASALHAQPAPAPAPTVNAGEPADIEVLLYLDVLEKIDELLQYVAPKPHDVPKPEDAP